MNENGVNMEVMKERYSQFSDLIQVLTRMRIDFSAFWSGRACCIEIRASLGTVCLTFNPSEDIEAVTCYMAKTLDVKVDSIALLHSGGMLFIRGYRDGSEVCLLTTKAEEIEER